LRNSPTTSKLTWPDSFNQRGRGGLADKLIAIATFSEPSQAEISKAKLEEAGIECFLTEDSTHGLYGYAAGAIRLQVRECDAERALEALKVDGRKRCAQCGQEVEDSAKYCPNCGAEIGHYEQRQATVWACSKCGEQIDAQFDTCWNCGTARSGTGKIGSPPMRPREPEPPTVPTYLTGAIAALFFCWPFAVLAIVHAVDAKRKLQAGNYAAACEASARAKTWCWISLVVGLVIIVLCLCFLIVGAVIS
jgi:RNA polymerase subunit RPABC4/transcription elongation factor Spt4